MTDVWTLPNGDVIDYWPPTEPGVLDDAAAQLAEAAAQIARLRAEETTVGKKDSNPLFDALTASVEAEKARLKAEADARQADIDAAVAKALEAERNK